MNELEKNFLNSLEEFNHAHDERDKEVQRLLHNTGELLSDSLEATTQACNALAEQYQEVNKTVGCLKNELSNLTEVLQSNPQKDTEIRPDKD